MLTLTAVPIAIAAEKEKVSDPRATIAPDNPNLHVRGGLGNLKRKLEGGQKCRIAFLGGSITENSSGHTAMLPGRLEARFPGAEFAVANAGWASTCSTSGAFRVESQVFAGPEVDLLVVEFAVNDDQDAAHSRQECVRGMEGIIRRVRRDHPDCDIVMVHFVNPSMLASEQRGEVPVPIAAHEAVAERYGVTSIDVAKEIAAATGAGRYSWDDYGGTHPSAFGYQVASNMIMAAIEAGLAKADDPPAAPAADLPEPLDGNSYDRGELVGPEQAQRSGEWKIGKVGRALLPLGDIRQQYEKFDVLRGDVIGAELELDFDGRGVGAFVLAGPEAGRLEASIDGGEFVEHDLFHHFSASLNYPRSVVFASDLTPGKHTLKLRIAAGNNPKSQGHAASILFFEVNR